MSSQNFEQQITFYHNVYLYCAIAALIFLLIAIVLFFALKIPKVFGEMTGRDARKAIDEMMAENATSGSLTSMKLGEDGRRRRRGRTGSLSTGKLRKNTSIQSRGLGKNSADSYQDTAVPPRNTFGAMPTEKKDNAGNTPTDVPSAYGAEPTDMPDAYGSKTTDVLNCENKSTNMPDDYGSEPTDVLNVHGNISANAQENNMAYQQPANETMVLNQNIKQGEHMFVILRSIVEVHTDEVI